MQNIVKKILGTPFLRVSGDFENDTNTVAVASGSCSEIIPPAFEKGVDVIITGDMKYHNMIDMTELGICVIDAGHYPTEICVMDIFEDIIITGDMKYHNMIDMTKLKYASLTQVIILLKYVLWIYLKIF